MTRRRKPGSKYHLEPKTCMVRGCGREIERWQRLCGGCWVRLPWHRRRAIAEAMAAPHVASRLAIEAAAWLEQNTPAAEAARRCGERP